MFSNQNIAMQEGIKEQQADFAENVLGECVARWEQSPPIRQSGHRLLPRVVSSGNRPSS
ncbi:hypothetical protein [Glaciimonas immobilis]|nr:hypothetical protein [Glaciimonas immobilis]